MLSQIEDQTCIFSMFKSVQYSCTHSNLHDSHFVVTSGKAYKLVQTAVSTWTLPHLLSNSSHLPGAVKVDKPDLKPKEQLEHSSHSDSRISHNILKPWNYSIWGYIMRGNDSMVSLWFCGKTRSVSGPWCQLSRQANKQPRKPQIFTQTIMVSKKGGVIAVLSCPKISQSQNFRAKNPWCFQSSKCLSILPQPKKNWWHRKAKKRPRDHPQLLLHLFPTTATGPNDMCFGG